MSFSQFRNVCFQQLECGVAVYRWCRSRTWTTTRKLYSASSTRTPTVDCRDENSDCCSLSKFDPCQHRPRRGSPDSSIARIHTDWLFFSTSIGKTFVLVKYNWRATVYADSSALRFNLFDQSNFCKIHSADCLRKLPSFKTILQSWLQSLFF